MKLLEQLFSKGLEIKDEESGMYFLLKKQPTQVEYNNMSIIAAKDLDTFIDNPVHQHSVVSIVENIEKFEFEGEDVDLELDGFVTQRYAVIRLFIALKSELKELKKK